MAVHLGERWADLRGVHLAERTERGSADRLVAMTEQPRGASLADMRAGL